MSTGVFVAEDGCRLVYEDVGQGLPVLWQHGLGADRSQPAEVFPQLRGVRRITLECRGHGDSALGPHGALSIVQFATDALRLLDGLRIKTAVFGGISLGAALAMRLATLFPERALGLVLARPAWVHEPAPRNLAILREVAALLSEYGPVEGAARFEASSALRDLEAMSPDNARSMRGFFKRDLPSTVALLGHIPAQGPGLDERSIAAIGCPTLIIANGQDPTHPVGLARTLQSLIPGAQRQLITSKSVNRDAYVDEFRGGLRAFLEVLAARSGSDGLDTC